MIVIIIIVAVIIRHNDEWFGSGRCRYEHRKK